MAYWIKYKNTIDGPELHGSVDDLDSFIRNRILIDYHHIPYPSSPVLQSNTGCPPFCYDPEGSCKNRSSCPKSYACSE